jgi:sugar transferase (PEP-CTERM/EpsH1 system associated)
MRILYLAHRIPYPPDKGDKIRSFHQIAHLARRHEVWCACFVDDPSDQRHVDSLRGICEKVAAIPLCRRWAMAKGFLGMLRGDTVTEAFYRSREMFSSVTDWSKRVRFDAVLAFSSSMAPYALRVPAGRRVLDFCDLDSRKWADYARFCRFPWRWLHAMEARRLGVMERLWSPCFDAVTVVTESEAAPLRGFLSEDQLHVVNNGVTIEPETNVPPSSNTVGFVGAMDYFPNVDAVCWFVGECWPRILAECPNATFRIVGRAPTRRVRRLVRSTNVEVVGAVEDARAEIRRFTVCVAPLRIARGVQNKVLEAMAEGRPVVLTSFAAEGIAGRDSEPFRITDTPELFAHQVAHLLGDANQRRRIGMEARRFVSARHRWDVEIAKLESILLGRNVKSEGKTRLPSSCEPAVAGLPR